MVQLSLFLLLLLELNFISEAVKSLVLIFGGLSSFSHLNIVSFNLIQMELQSNQVGISLSLAVFLGH